MNRKEYKRLSAIADAGTLPDNQNPIFTLSSVSIYLLSQAAKGEIDLKELAKRELENRGFDINSKWVGFDKEIK